MSSNVRISKWRPFTSTMHGDPKTHTTGEVWKEVAGNLYNSNDAAKSGDETTGSVGNWVNGTDGSSNAFNALGTNTNNVTDGTQCIRMAANGANQLAHIPISGLTTDKTYRFKFDMTIPGHDAGTKGQIKFGKLINSNDIYSAYTNEIDTAGRGTNSAIGYSQDTFTFVKDLKATGTTVYLSICQSGSSNDFECFLDNISVLELEDITNPYYKNYFGGYITTMELWPTYDGANHTIHLDSHYNITEPYPTSLSEDFTVIVNPYKRKLKKQDKINEATGITISAVMTNSALFGGGTRRYWMGGVNLFSSQSNDGVAGPSFDQMYRRIAVDYDDLEAHNQISGDKGFGSLLSDEYNTQAVGDDGLLLPKYSTGFTQGKFIRFAAGMTTFGASFSPAQLHGSFNILDIAVIPHRPRGFPLT